VPAAFVIEFWWAFIALAVVLAIVFGVVQARNIKAAIERMHQRVGALLEEARCLSD
jgi:hypothetical protein